MSATQLRVVIILAAASAAGCRSKGSEREAEAKSAAGKAQPGAESVAKKPSEPVHPVYSLIDNRLSAHVLAGGGIRVWAGSAGFAKYIRFADEPDWQLRNTVDGKKVATMKGTAAYLDVPLDAPAAKEAAPILLRVHRADAGRLTLRINDKKDSEINLEVPAGWSTLKTVAPASSLEPGDNRVVLFASDGEPMSLEWMQIGSETEPKGSPFVKTDGQVKLQLPRGGGLAYYVTVPARAKLRADVSSGCKVRVSLRTDGAASPLTGELSGPGSLVDLSSYGKRVAELRLENRSCPQALVHNAALVVPGKAPAYQRPKAPAPEYVILWVMDSLRADRVKTFWPSARARTPNFDALAKDSTLFVRTYVQGNESRSSHAAIWSSLYAVKHRFFTHRGKLDTKWTTIDEIAKKAGLYASGVSGNGYITKRRGFGTAWNAFRNHIHLKAGLTGEAIYEQAMASVKGKTKPWFLYLGTIDTHVTWRAKKPWIDEYDKGYKGRFTKFAGSEHVKDKVLPERDRERIRAIYDSNVSYQDELLGRLMKQLGKWGIRDKTMLIVTADHGDEQWESGPTAVGHGETLRETVVHVPLLIRYPPLFPGSKVRQGVEVVDILPTVADVLGVDPDPQWQGRSLVAVANGIGADYPAMTLATYPNLSKGNVVREVLAARVGDWKVEVFAGRPVDLYNLADDPHEKKNRAAEARYARRYMLDLLWLLRAYNDAWKKSEWGTAANVTPKFAAAMGE